MKHLTSITLAALALCSAASASAQSDCAPEFDQASQTITVADIVASAGGATTEPFQIRVRNGGNPGATCPATIRIARLSTSPSTNTIAYSLQQGGQVVQILPSETSPGTASSDTAINQLPTGTAGASVPFRLTIPSGWGIGSGSQTDDLIALLLDRSGAVVDTMLLRVALTIAPAAEIRIVGATGLNAIASINLGTLNPQITNISDPFGVRIWSTSPYTVSFRSENDGELVHTEIGRSIAYKLYRNDERLNVAGAPAIYVPAKTDALGDHHPLRIRIEPFQARAGNYTDRIEVTVTAG